MAGLEQGRDNNFDLLRLLAAVAVFVSHSFVIYGLHEPALLVDGDGFGVTIAGLGVTFFFAISGFLITGSWLKSQDVKTYLQNRALRVYPALFLNFIVVALLIAPFASASGIIGYFSELPGLLHKVILGSLIFSMPDLPGVFASNAVPYKVNVPLWTLVFEVFCYMLVCALGVVSRLKITIPLITLAYIVLFYERIFYPHAGGDLGLLHIAAFLLASCFALYRQYLKWPHMFAALCIAGLAWLFAANIYILPVYLLLAVYLTLYLGLYVKPLANTSRYGDFSYGLYIYAWPVQQAFVQLFTLGFIANLAASFIVTLALAAMSWHLVERRALMLKAR